MTITWLVKSPVEVKKTGSFNDPTTPLQTIAESDAKALREEMNKLRYANGLPFRYPATVTVERGGEVVVAHV